MKVGSSPLAKWFAKNSGHISKSITARRVYVEALRIGTIVRQKCEICGDPNSHGHHEDYNKPLEVIWLCQKHHSMRHKELNNQRRKEIEQYSMEKEKYPYDYDGSWGVK